MKKLLITSLLTLSSSVFAHGPHSHFHGPYYGPNNWVAPLIIGGVVGYTINRPPPPVVVYNPPVTNLPTVQQQTCSPWTEIQNNDGTITRTRTCSQ